jgi:hypothetical protein
MNFVVFISIFATVSQPLPSEAAADSVQIAEEALPLSGKFGLDPTTGWSLRPVVNGTPVEYSANNPGSVIYAPILYFFSFKTVLNGIKKLNLPASTSGPRGWV